MNTLRNSFLAIARRNIALLALILCSFWLYDRIVVSDRSGYDRALPYLTIIVLYSWVFMHNVFLVERYFLKSRYVLYSVFVFAGVIAFAMLQQSIVNMERRSENKPEDAIVWYILIFAIYAVIGAVVYFARLYILERSRFYKASAISRQLELNQLKTQLNPHFLFNSLNNIYSYNLENQRHGNDLILKLAELVRFILEAAPREMITVHEELLFIENFIAFEQERIGHRCEIRFIRNVQFADRQISPLVMFPFIENAFKHGTDTDRDTSIVIEIQDSEDRLELYVKNDIIKTTKPSPKIGLSNIEKRLSILFPGRYQLKTSNDGVHYAVNLVLT